MMYILGVILGALPVFTWVAGYATGFTSGCKYTLDELNIHHENKKNKYTT